MQKKLRTAKCHSVALTQDVEEKSRLKRKAVQSLWFRKKGEASKRATESSSSNQQYLLHLQILGHFYHQMMNVTERTDLLPLLVILQA